MKSFRNLVRLYTVNREHPSQTSIFGFIHQSSKNSEARVVYLAVIEAKKNHVNVPDVIQTGTVMKLKEGAVRALNRVHP